MCYKDSKKRKEYNKRYYWKHRSKALSNNKQWRLDNKEQQKLYRLKNKSKKKNFYLQFHYGLTLEQYNEMFIKQNGCCAICGKHQSELKRSLCVDHNHVTNKVRCLLCERCNRVLGSVDESITLLTSIITYLRNNESI